jgi:hypothetical protein
MAKMDNEVAMHENVATGKGADDVLPLAALLPDPRNARRHSERNLDLIEQSLREVGAARSIMLDEAGTILAGNATVAAAERAGIGQVRIVEADGTELVAVRRSGLSEEQKRPLAQWDKRAPELAEWDSGVLAVLAEDTDLSGLWEPAEPADLLGTEAPRAICSPIPTRSPRSRRNRSPSPATSGRSAPTACSAGTR